MNDKYKGIDKILLNQPRDLIHDMMATIYNISLEMFNIEKEILSFENIIINNSDKNNVTENKNILINDIMQLNMKFNGFYNACMVIEKYLIRPDDSKIDQLYLECELDNLERRITKLLNVLNEDDNL